jgi:hypothetical protein
MKRALFLVVVGLALAPASAAAGGPAGLVTVPFWQSSFTYAGTAYPFQMVGTDPTGPGATTVVPTVLIPIDLTFVDARGVSPDVDASPLLPAILGSPIFQPAAFVATNDTTQYGDAVQRAEFAGVLHGPPYHVLLGQPLVTAVAHLEVPAPKGSVADPAGDGVPRATVDSAWWSAQLQNLLDADHVSADELPVFVTRDLAVGGRVLGYHAAFRTGDHLQTLVWASWLDRGWATPFGFAAGFGTDVQFLGHEVAEWIDDPFDENRTPPWFFSVPPIASVACGRSLEVGDPLELAQFPVTTATGTYNLQDAAFLSWFARQSPSIGYDNRYSFLGTFGTYSQPC